MNEIEKSANIGQIIGASDEIALQINLLALSTTLPQNESQLVRLGIGCHPGHQR